MKEFLIYDLKVAVLIAVFYFFYRLLMERETMHRLNRIVLLSSILLSLALPLCVITFHKTIEIEQMRVVDRPELVITELGPVSEEESAGMRFLKNLLQPYVFFAIFMIGLLCRSLYIANSYRHLRRMIKDSEQHSLEDGVTLAVVDLPVAPFSWMRTIVLSRTDYEERNPSILAHERGHILQHHSWDIVFVEVLTALQWFNPVVWLLRRDLRTIHEYEADASVLSSGSDVGQYIQLLMRKATGTQACILANGINNSTIKKRIIMMLNKKNNRHAWLRALYVVPVVAVSLAVSARTVVDYQYAQPTNDKATSNAIAAEDFVVDQQVYDEKANENLKKEKTATIDATSDSMKSTHPMLEIRKNADNGKRPLVIINGTETPYDELVSISPNIIKSVTVLKDKASLDLYGSKGKDGVIIVEIEDHPNQKGHEPFKVSGRVVDENNKPVVGAVVMIRGTKKGSVSDTDGNFTIEAPDGATIDVSYVGMATSSFKTNRVQMAPEKGKEHVTTVMLKADGSADDTVKVNGTARYHATATWKPADDATEFHGVATRAEDKANVSIFIDNKEVKSKETEMAGVINIPEDVVSSQIKSMAVDKSDPKQVKIYITTKK